MNTQTPPNPFATLQAMGYARLAPIIPPGAPISTRSNLHKRIEKGDDARGKAPGIKWPDGKWSGFDWLKHVPGERDAERWRDMGAGVGIVCGDGLNAIDADTLNPEFADIIEATQAETLGELPRRIGRPPKALSPFRCADDLPYARIEFGEPDDKGRLERVEILGTGRQFVAWGLHPATMQPYHWTKRLVPFDDLPLFEPAQIVAFLEELRKRLPKARPIVREGSAASVDQESLRGDVDLVRRAVAAMPNSGDRFAPREAWLGVGYAIKAALPDNGADALDIFQEWSARWDNPDKQNDPDIVAAEWARMRPPFRRGAGWLCDQAEEASDGAFQACERWLEPVVEEEPSIFPLDNGEPVAAKTPLVILPTPYGFPEPSAIPPRESLYAGHYVRQFVSSTIAPSKVGKTYMGITEALIMASGKPLLGISPAGQFRVWFWNGEDPLEEMQRRVAAAMQFHGLTREDLGDRLFLDSGRQTPICVAKQLRADLKVNEPVRDAILAGCRARAIDVAIMDPFIRTHKVSENDNVAIEEACRVWAYLADELGMAVELIHHVRKLNGTEVTVEDTRGASSMIGVVRSSRALARMTKVEGLKSGLGNDARRLFRFADTSSNLFLPADGENERWLELHSVNLGNGRGDGVLDAMMNGDSVAVVRLFDMPAASLRKIEEMAKAVDGVGLSAEARALEILADGMWRRDVQARDAWAGRAIMRAMDMDPDAKESVGQAKIILTAWIKAGKLREFERLDNHRKPRCYIEVV